MTNLSNLTYTDLQSIAKGFGVPANLKREQLQPILEAMMFQASAKEEEHKAKQVTAHSPVNNDMNNVFAMPEAQPQERPMSSALPNTTGYVSPKLLKFCVDLYKRFNMNTAELEGADYNFIRKQVDSLSSRPLPASEKQINMIHQIIAEINELGVEFAIDESILDGLTGGKDGTASQLVDFLFRKRTEAQANAPLTDKQAETLIKWFYCPDIPWETFDIQQKVALQIPGKDGAWRFMDTDEFTAELKSKMTKSEASKFIDDHNHNYYEWAKTRISQYQIDTIRQLEERMANIHSVGVKEYAIVDGVLTEVYKKAKREYAPRAYEPMTEAQIRQLSSTDASKLIDQMRYEAKMREQSALDKSNGQDELEKKVHGDPRDDRGGSKELRALNKEHQALTDFIFAMESALGQENEELHESITELMIHKVGDSLEVANQLREFIEFGIEQGAVSIRGLVQMGSESQTVQRLLQIINPVAYDTALHGAKSEEKEATPKAPTMSEAQRKAQEFINGLK